MSISRSEQVPQAPDIAPFIGEEPLTSFSQPSTTTPSHSPSYPVTAIKSVTISPPVTHFTIPRLTSGGGDGDGDYDVQGEDDDALYYPELSTTDDPSSISPFSRHRPPPPPPSSRHQKLFTDEENGAEVEDNQPDEEEEGLDPDDTELSPDAGGLYRRLTDEDFVVVIDNNGSGSGIGGGERSPSLSSALSRVAAEELSQKVPHIEDDPVNNALSRLMGASMAAAQVQAAAVQAAAAAGLDHYDTAIRLPLPTSVRTDSAPLKKLSVDLIKTYKQINEVCLE